MFPLDSGSEAQIIGCPFESADFSTADYIKYAFRQWKNGTPVHDALNGPHWLVDMVRYWDFLDSQEQQRRMEDLQKGRG